MVSTNPSVMNIADQTSMLTLSGIESSPAAIKENAQSLKMRQTIFGLLTENFGKFLANLEDIYKEHKDALDKINPELGDACRIYSQAQQNRAKFIEGTTLTILPQKLPTTLLMIVADYLGVEEYDESVKKIPTHTLLDMAYLMEKPLEYFKSINFIPFDRQRLKNAKVTKENYKDYIAKDILEPPKLMLHDPEIYVTYTFIEFFARVLGKQMNLQSFRRPQEAEGYFAIQLSSLDGRLVRILKLIPNNRSRSTMQKIGTVLAYNWFAFNVLRLTYADFCRLVKDNMWTAGKKAT